MNRLTRGLVTAAVLVHASAAHAQSDEARADARAAAGEGAAAFRDGKFAEAVDFFERAESMVHAPPHLLYIARSYAALGKLVKARETYRKVLREQLDPAAPPAFQRAQQAAQTELPELEARIPTIKVSVEGAPANALSATMDGVAIPPALIGIPRPVDPGEHKFRAIGEELDSGEQSITVAEKAKEALVLKLAAAPGVHLKPAAPEPAATPEATPATTPAANGVTAPADTGAAPQGNGTSPLRIASYAAFGVGAIGLGLGTVFALQSHSTRKGVDDLCADGGCLETDRPKVDDEVSKANGQGRLAVIGFITGGIGVAAGVTLFVLGGQKHAEGSAAAPSVRGFVGPRTVGLSGRF